MDESKLRAAIVAETNSWIGTPYVSNALIKGRRGGTDCAMLFIGVYQNVGLVPKDFDPRPYPPDWHVHRNEEKYLGYVQMFANEVAPPPERMPLPGDVVVFKIGRVFAHGAIIVDWPNVVHAVGNDMVSPMDISKDIAGKRALWLMPKRFFSPKELLG